MRTPRTLFGRHWSFLPARTKVDVFRALHPSQVSCAAYPVLVEHLEALRTRHLQTHSQQCKEHVLTHYSLDNEKILRTTRFGD